MDKCGILDILSDFNDEKKNNKNSGQQEMS